MKKLITIFLTAVLLISTVCYADDSWNCPDCGQLVTGNFCNNCGAKRPQNDICPNCGLPFTGNFCSNCGAKRPTGNTVSYNIGDTFTFGVYEQDGDLRNGPEPIEWLVIQAYSNNRVWAVSKKLLDVVDYNDEEPSDVITWEKCSLRRWLNNQFFNTSFTAEEQNAIDIFYTSDWLEDGQRPKYENPTEDKVIILGVKEAEAFLNGNYKAELTDYAMLRGAETFDSIYGYWWLRTTDLYEHYDNAPFCTSGIDRSGIDVGKGFPICVRPCINVYTNKIPNK